MKNLSIILTLILSIFMVSCANTNTNNETIKTEVEEITKSVDEMMDIAQTVKPESTLSTDELITRALLKHYDKQFGETNNTYKTTGYKMYTITSDNPHERKAYGFATYMEYNDDGNDGVTNEAGSGPTGIAITFKTDGSDSNVDYEVLTESDLGSAAFKMAFPENVQKKILDRNMDDIAEVERKEQEMLKRLYKEKNGKDLK